MDRLLYIAMNAAKHSVLQQASTAHNLANVNTTGFKAQFNSFIATPVQGPGMPTRAFSVATSPGTDMSFGTIQTTGRPLDIAVNGNGWIAVQDSAGQEAYTRNGSLQVTASGLLVTSTGHPVLGDGGPITIPEDAEVTIGKDGTITVLTNNQPNALTAIARIKLVNPPDANMLRGEDGLFRQANGQPAVEDAAVTLVSGGLETSNVNSVKALVDIIDQSRFFDFQTKLMQKADENANRATTLMAFNT